MTSRPNSLKFVRHNIEGAINLTQCRKWYTDPPASPAGDPPAPPPAPPTPTPPQPADDEKPTLSQKHVDKLMGNTRKETEDKTTKKLLEQFGVDPNDPKAVDAVKALIAAGKQAEDSKKSAETLAQEKITQLEKERDEAQLAADNIKQERLLELRDNGIKAALSDPKVHCKDPATVFDLLKVRHPQELAAALKDDGTLDADKVKALVELGRKETPVFFTGGGPSIPSNMGNGRPSDPDLDAKKRASRFNNEYLRG